MILTDIDGIKVDVNADVITGLQTLRKAGRVCTAVFVPESVFYVVESPAEIMRLIRKEKTA